MRAVAKGAVDDTTASTGLIVILAATRTDARGRSRDHRNGRLAPRAFEAARLREGGYRGNQRHQNDYHRPDHEPCRTIYHCHHSGFALFPPGPNTLVSLQCNLRSSEGYFGKVLIYHGFRGVSAIKLTMRRGLSGSIS